MIQDSFGLTMMVVYAAMMHLFLVLTAAACVTMWRLEPMQGLAAVWAFGTAIELFLWLVYWCIEG